MKPMTYRILGVAVAVAGVLTVSLIVCPRPPLTADGILAACNAGSKYDALTVQNPLNETLFPPEIAAPRFRWKDSNLKSDAWVVRVRFQDNEGPLRFLARAPEWTPSDKQWEEIKRRSLERNAQVDIIGVRRASPKKIRSSATIAIRTSRDRVDAPLFYREVNLPFMDAVKDPSRIRWRFGTIASKAQPPVVLTGLRHCGNCHSFSADGRVLGMDVDFGNDKGAYVITRVEKEMTLATSKFITWNDYEREDKEPTYGLLSQVSPDAQYTVSTVKDHVVFEAKPDLAFSQLFFPLKGILAVYTRATGSFSALPGADDRSFVQSNPSWSPDGRYIVFARSKAGALLAPAEEYREYLLEGKTFLFDLYTVPFNGGKGGKAEPLKGASNNGMSNYFAKYSPDGKWIVFCKAKSYMLLQPDSQFYIMPAAGGEARRMRCNTPCMNSWHSWSPNSRWLVFSSKANGPYTQLFLTHIDAEGNDSPPVLLDWLTSPDRAVNIPEFVNTSPLAIAKIHGEFIDDVSFVRAGLEFLNGNDYDRAIGPFRKALTLNPENADAHDHLGFLLLKQGKLEEALAHFAEAIRLKPELAEAHYNLGSALTRQGKVEEAVAEYAEAIRLNPRSALAHNALGVALAGQGKTQEAAAHFAEAVRLKPDFAEAHNNLGLTLELQGKDEDALAHFRRAVEIRPDYEESRPNLQRALHEETAR
jgi:Flp pilus assembly protein TadD